MSELPVSWASAGLGEITTISPKFNADDVKDEHLVHFVPMAATDEEFGGVDVSQLRPLREVRKGYTTFAEGDVLFAKITPCMENGKGGLVPRLPHKYAFGSTEFHVLRPSEAITSLWLAHFLSQAEFRKIARRNMTGTAGQLRVPTKWLETVRLPVPPLSEQTRIVEKLEELLGSLDAAVGELKAAQRKLTHYRQSLLKAAMEGELTAQWRNASCSSFPRKRESSDFKRGTAKTLDSRFRGNDGMGEPGPGLLHRILQERRTRWEEKQQAKFAQTGKTPPKGWQAKYPEPVAPDTADLPALPERWVWASVEQLGEVTTGFTPSTSNAAFFGGTIPFFKPSDLDAGYDLREYRESLTELGAAQGRMLPVKSILVTCIGATIGKTALARVACTTNQQINSISVSSDSILPEYVYFVMVSNFGQRQIIDNASATTLPILNKSKFEKLLVPLPPCAEQDAIIDSLEAALFAIKEQETAITHSLHQAAAQRRNLLRAAFSGQLVPQDPNDEPASELLARIRAAKTESASKTKPAMQRKRKA